MFNELIQEVVKYIFLFLLIFNHTIAVLALTAVVWLHLISKMLPRYF